MPILNWIGKNKVINHHLDIPFHTLNEEYKFNTASNSSLIDGLEDTNKIIHADNLLALKSLLPQYEGKIKCIYIDPPYNTGNEGWLYNDNVSDPKFKKWLKAVVGREGEDLTRHDKWLCMMYPRLKLLHKLLADDGAIFISIDDNEQASLKLMCDEIFGGGNYLGNIIWRKKEGGGQTDKYFVTEHEYISIYQKSNNFCWIDTIRTKTDKEFNKIDERGKFKLTKLEKWGSGARKEDRPTMHFPILMPNNEEYLPIAPDGNDGRWRVGKTTMSKLIAEDLIHWEFKNGKYLPYEKTYQGENDEVKVKERSILFSLTNTAEASKTLTEIFGKKDSFDTPKPYQLIEFFVKHSTDKNSIILDSFAGSGTTAHAVLNLNKQDGGNRKFILIEMEDYAESITAERVKRVINGYADKEGLGGNFTYYTLGERVLDDDNNLNQNLALNKIHQYIWYAETHTAYNHTANIAGYLGKHQYTGIYFNYNPNEVTVLDEAYLMNVTELCEQYIIYADMCLLPQMLLEKHNIIFKKIPRDISKL